MQVRNTDQIWRLSSPMRCYAMPLSRFDRASTTLRQSGPAWVWEPIEVFEQHPLLYVFIGKSLATHYALPSLLITAY